MGKRTGERVTSDTAYLELQAPNWLSLPASCDIYWTCERTSDISADITYYYSLLLFPFLMHFA